MCEKMNGYILKNARVIDPGRNIDTVGDIAVSSDGVFVEPSTLSNPEVIDLTGKVVALPTKEDIDFEIAVHLIVELYSK